MPPSPDQASAEQPASGRLDAVGVISFMQQNHLLHGVAEARLLERARRLTSRMTPIPSHNQCARMDSNHHGEISPQGPQPCASTNSATSAECASIAPHPPVGARGERPIRPPLASVHARRYIANTCSS